MLRPLKIFVSVLFSFGNMHKPLKNNNNTKMFLKCSAIDPPALVHMFLVPGQRERENGGRQIRIVAAIASGPQAI
jgi:hypothetical protein